MKTLFGSKLLMLVLLLGATGWLYLSLEQKMLAADTSCGGQPCVETTVCASLSVVECSDWNNGSTDGWAVSPWGGGSIKPGVGFSGSSGWESTITAGQHGTVYFDKPVSGVGYGPLHARFYVKFSPGYIFMPSGLQKMFYLQSTKSTAFWRIMLGVTRANEMGGAFGSQPNTVGVFGFDYIGHLVRLPNQAGDSPVLISSNRWYAVEIMAHWTSRTQNVVRVWVDGQLQMTRSNFNDGVWTTAHTFDSVQDSSHHGGDGPPYVPSQTQYVYKDNHVIGKSFIGPIGSADKTAPVSPIGILVR